MRHLTFPSYRVGTVWLRRTEKGAVALKDFVYTMELSTTGDARTLLDGLVQADRRIRHTQSARDRRMRFQFKLDDKRPSRLTVSLRLSAASWEEASDLGIAEFGKLVQIAKVNFASHDAQQSYSNDQPRVESQGYELASA